MKTPILDKIINIVKTVIKLPRRKKRGKPFIYPVKDMTTFFHIMVLKRITHFKTMRRFLINSPAAAQSRGFKKSIPDHYCPNYASFRLCHNANFVIARERSDRSNLNNEAAFP